MKKILRKFWAAPLLCSMLYGCGTMKALTGWGHPSQADKVIEAVAESKESLTVFSAVGGLCLMAGMALLVISKGTMGWRPIIGGIVLVLLNYMILEYADWIFIPVIIATGCISAAWGWKIFLSIINKEYKHGKYCK